MSNHYTSGYAGTPDSLGLNSREAVRAAQQAINAQMGGGYLKADGIWGAKTEAAYNSLFGSSTGAAYPSNSPRHAPSYASIYGGGTGGGYTGASYAGYTRMESGAGKPTWPFESISNTMAGVISPRRRRAKA